MSTDIRFQIKCAAKVQRKLLGWRSVKVQGDCRRSRQHCSDESRFWPEVDGKERAKVHLLRLCHRVVARMLWGNQFGDLSVHFVERIVEEGPVVNTPYSGNSSKLLGLTGFSQASIYLSGNIIRPFSSELPINPTNFGIYWKEASNEESCRIWLPKMRPVHGGIRIDAVNWQGKCLVI